MTSPQCQKNVPVQSDGFVELEHRKEIGWPLHCPFTTSPIPFFKEVIALRRNGQGFGHTHIGHLLSGRELRADAFDDLKEERIEGIEN
jgi:hypothetical protein